MQNLSFRRRIFEQCVPNRDEGRGNRPVINLNHLNQFIPNQHFKMEGLLYQREMLQKDDSMCKLDMNDA